MFHYIYAHVLALLLAGAMVHAHAQDQLEILLDDVKVAIESQGSIKLKNGSKGGWQFERNGCSCTYRKVQYVKSGTNYAQIDWTITFDLADMEDAQYIEYDNHAVILRVRGGEDLVQTHQVKLYRNYTTTEERFGENSVYIDIRNRADSDRIVSLFQRAIEMCTMNDR